MRHHPRRNGSTSPIVIVLLALILVALGVLIGVILSRGGGSPTPDRKAGPTTAAAGETVTREKLVAAGIQPVAPSKAIVDTKRVQETYKPGQKHRIVLKGSLKSRASAKDWGVVQEMTLLYAAETETLRTILSNDGTTLVEILEITKARNLGIFCHVEDVRIELGLPSQLVLAGLDIAYGTPGLWSSLNGSSAKQLLGNIPAVQSWADRVYTDQAAKTFMFVDTLEGKKVRIEYVNGKGVTKLTPIGCSLSGEEQSFLMDTASISDLYVLPKLDCKEGDSWTVQGEDFLPVLDPSLRTSVTGSLTAVRGQDIGTKEQPSARITLNQGTLDLRSADAASETVGRWAPRGELTYSFADGVVTEGRLSGAIHLDKHSTDHILFEARQIVEPAYDVTYSCEILR